MTGAVLLAWAAYLALGIYCVRRAWRVSRGFPGWARRLTTCMVFAVFFAPSLIPAGHGVGFGPALIAGAIWQDAEAVAKFMLLPMAAMAAAGFALASLCAAVRDLGVAPAPTPNADAAESPVGRVEIVAAALLLSLPAIGFTGLRHAHAQWLQGQRETSAVGFAGQVRAERDATASGAWRREVVNQRETWVLRLAYDSGAASGITLARTPVAGELMVMGTPGTLPPGTVVNVRTDEGRSVGSATADANGGFEVRLTAKQDAYLRVVPIQFVRASGTARSGMLRASPVQATQETQPARDASTSGER